jgi:hypothetical protein
LKGGRIIPKYNTDYNTPFTTNGEKLQKKINFQENEEKENLKKKMGNNREDNTPKPLMSMTVMDTILGDKKKKTTQPNTIYPSLNVPMPNPYNPIASTYMVPWNYNNYNVPVIKKYNISINGVDGNLTSVAEIFEDILPPTHVAQNRMTTLSERHILYSYIRSILVKRGDGEEIGFSQNRPEIINLLSYMKMLEINPYHFSRLTNNPYRTMPDNFLMFRSCYPIRLEKNSNYIMCGKESIGANVRIYAMNIYDELANKINYKGIRKNYSDVWREIVFYQYIREEILKKNICPHFPYLYSYYITKNTGLDFDKIKLLKKNYVDKNIEIVNDNELIKKTIFSDTINSMISEDKQKGLVLNVKNFKKYIENTSGPVNLDIINKKHNIIYGDNKKTVIFDLSNNKLEVDITKRSSQCLVAITEAPNQNIINWSTRSYVIDDGPVRKQLNTGIHDVLTWKSVIFQILVAFYVMDLKKITIKEMSWTKNIFIKDLDQTNSIGYWKYKIGGIDYYIPNMGALVIIDSSYDEMKDGFNNENLDNNLTIKFKLNGDIFNDEKSEIKYAGLDLKVTENDINKVLIDNFNRLFSPNVFALEFVNYGGIKPPAEIIHLLESISECNYRGRQNNTNAHDSLSDVILDNFKTFLHNKIGKIVSETEKPQLYPDGENVEKCNKGNLVAVNMNHINNSYFWGIFLGSSDEDEGNYNILTIRENLSLIHI